MPGRRDGRPEGESIVRSCGNAQRPATLLVAGRWPRLRRIGGKLPLRGPSSRENRRARTEDRYVSVDPSTLAGVSGATRAGGACSADLHQIARLTLRMQSFIGVTDFDWYRQLSARTDLDEVNFWKPGGRATFRALTPGGLFLFKLHAPHNAIVGGGFFGHFSKVPVSLAWDVFGAKNGVRDLGEFRRRIEQYRRGTDGREDYTIGCILLEEPFFLPRDQWIPQPADWQPNVVQGAGYDLSTGAGRVLWDALQERLGQRQDRTLLAEATRRFGEPTVVLPRLGQGTFRVAVTDAYDRRCAITGERTLPVLQAAHIHPYADGGPHRVPNGLLLRSDLHTLRNLSTSLRHRVG